MLTIAVDTRPARRSPEAIDRAIMDAEHALDMILGTGAALSPLERALCSIFYPFTGTIGGRIVERESRKPIVDCWMDTREALYEQLAVHVYDNGAMSRVEVVYWLRGVVERTLVHIGTELATKSKPGTDTRPRWFSNFLTVCNLLDAALTAAKAGI